MRLRRWVRASVVGGFLLAACGEGSQVPGGSTGPEEPGPPASGVVASAPVARTLLGQPGSETVAFVAAPIGTVARGRGAVLVNRRTGARVNVMVAAGGFDPVALVADDGDVVEVTLSDSAGQVTTTPLAVKRGAKPRVVRTAPEPRATDVPLNSVIRVVFTTPVRASAAAGAIRLFSGGVEVAGSIQVNGEADVFVDFVPAAPLAANAAYELRVDPALTDVLGQSLEAAVAVSFTTGATATAPPITNPPTQHEALLVGDELEWTLLGCDGGYCLTPLADVNWSSTSPAIATVTVTGPGRVRISALSPGVTLIVATSGNFEARMEVSVHSTESAPPITNLRLSGFWGRLQVGDTLEVTALGCYGWSCHHPALTGVNWSATSPGIATVTVTGPGRARISALSPGMTWIVANDGNFEARMDVFVASTAASPVGTGANEIVFASRDPDGSMADSSEVASNLFAIRDDGTGLTRLTSSATESYDRPSVARDGRIVFVVRHVDRSELAVREPDGTVRPLAPEAPPEQRWVDCPTWSPDARYVAYADFGNGTGTSIRVVRADGSGAIVAEISPHGTCPSWSPDGTQLSYGTLGGLANTLIVADASRFPEVSTRDVSTRGRTVGFGRWSPAGDALASLVEDEDWLWLELTPLSGGAGTRLARMGIDSHYGNPTPEWSPDGRLILFWGVLVDVNAGWVDWESGRLPISSEHATFVPAGVRFTR